MLHYAKYMAKTRFMRQFFISTCPTYRKITLAPCDIRAERWSGLINDGDVLLYNITSGQHICGQVYLGGDNAFVVGTKKVTCDR